MKDTSNYSLLLECGIDKKMPMASITTPYTGDCLAVSASSYDNHIHTSDSTHIVPHTLMGCRHTCTAENTSVHASFSTIKGIKVETTISIRNEKSVPMEGEL